METEGIRRALQFLHGEVNISELVTYASRSIMSLLGELVFYVFKLWILVVFHYMCRKRISRLLPFIRCVAQFKKVKKSIVRSGHCSVSVWCVI